MSTEPRDSLFPPWLEPPLRHLTALAASGQPPPGLLVAGPQGVGKRLLVRTFLQRTACTLAGESLFPCGECNGCRSCLAGTHPEILEVTPEEPGKEILVDAVRAVTEFLSLSHSGPARLVFIEPAEAMNANAANALLKTLEEPPAGAMILLAAARPARLPATIRSRCRLLRVPLPAAGEASRWLQHFSGSDMTLEQAIAASLNRPLEAAELLRDAGAAQAWRRDQEALSALLESQSPFPVIRSFLDCDLKSLIPRLQCLLLSAQYFLSTGEHDGFGRLFERHALEAFSRRLGAMSLARLSAESMRWHREIAVPLNPDLRCEALVLRLMSPDPRGTERAGLAQGDWW